MERLREAARAGNVEDLHSILEEEPEILSWIDGKSFVDTPLHVAARLGNSKFAAEIAVFRPSLTRKLNPKGLSPMHVAMKAGQWETVRVLVEVDPELIRVKGSGGETALHVAAEMAPPELLAELLFVCPMSIQDVTADWETAAHRAVEKENVAALKILIEWTNSVSKTLILSWKNIAGNTALHLAARAGSKEMVKMLVRYVSKVRANFNGKKAWDMVVDADGRDFEEIRSLLAVPNHFAALLVVLQHRPFATINTTLGTVYGTSRLYWLRAVSRFMGFRLTLDGDKRRQKSRDVVLLIAVLIATTTYQAMLTPPGGYWQDDSSSSSSNTTTATDPTPHVAGDMIISGSKRLSFVLFNSLAFCFSVAAIVVNVIQLEQKFMLVAATYILLFSYFAAPSSLPETKDNSGQVLSVISRMTLVIAVIYTIVGFAVALEVKWLMDSPERNIRLFVQWNRPGYQVAVADAPQHALPIGNQ